MANSYGTTTTTKARVVFFKKDGSGEQVPEEKPQTIQLNPSEIYISEVYKTNVNEGIANPKDSTKVSTGEISVQNISMTLYFDLVKAYESAEYESKRQNKNSHDMLEGLLQNFDGQLESLTDFDNFKNLCNPDLGADELNINNEKFTCFPRLNQAAEKQEKLIFIWGHQTYIGVITNFNSRFTYFSPRGEPLRAVVQLTLQVLGDKEAEELIKKAKD